MNAAPGAAPAGGAARDFRREASMVPVGRIAFHPRNIRAVLTDLDELAASIRAEAVLQPLLAHRKFRAAADVQNLELIAGHRLLAAAEITGLRRVPVVIVAQMPDDAAMFAMLGEDKKQAVPLEDRARAITSLHDEFGHSYPVIAARLGISTTVLQAWREGHEPRRGRRRRSTHSARPGAPRIRPSVVHELCARWDSGDLDAAVMVGQLRALLGGWEPETRPQPGDPRTGSPERSGLHAGTDMKEESDEPAAGA